MDHALSNAPRPLSSTNPPRLEGPYQGPKHHPKDEACGFEILDNFERFNHANDIFNRGQWDERIRSKKVLDWFKSLFRTDIGPRAAEGYTVKDFALRNAGWMNTNLVIQRSLHLDRVDGFLDDIREYGPPAKTKVPVETPEAMTLDIKRVCKLFGADAVGITHYDPRWHYTRGFSTQTLTDKPHGIPEDLPNVIVLVTAMPHDSVSTYPSATAGLAVGLGYSRDCEMVQSVASFIQNMGYRAVACVNDTSQAIPYAIQAGLGEYGRHGLLITKDFGPRVRIGRIHTDLPLTHDEPIRFGVREFCETCRRCSDSCPPKAIPSGPPQSDIINQSNIVGIRKWTVDAERCFKFWVNQGTECGICMRVCPYNKDNATWYGRLYLRAWQRLAGSGLRRVALWLDIKLGFGKRLKPNLWWERLAKK